MAVNELYANTKDTGFVLNFFSGAAKNPKVGLLAAPFFTTTEPIDQLTSEGCDIRLIVRFSPATTPEALRRAFENPKVKVRYFTDAKFHTKLYIIDNVALVGSANLTDSGLKFNRELSIVIRRGFDAVYDKLPDHFESLWADADVLNKQILKDYTEAYNSLDRPENEEAFERYIHKSIAPAAPRSIVVGSEKKSKERSFIQSFRQKYDEILIPFHHEISSCARSHGFGRSEYAGYDHQIEMGRFLGWLRLTQGSGEGWRETSLLREPTDRSMRIKHYIDVWQSTDDTVKGDTAHAANEIQNITNIKNFLSRSEELMKLTYDEIFDYLTGCHAFLERLRFAPRELGNDLSGLERLRIDFQSKNSHDAVLKTVDYLLSGSGDAIDRAYDCIFGAYKLNGFGEACVMELLGWGVADRQPFNNRTIRGMRLLGFDVENLVAGE